jgi:hypothetical protein
MLMDFTETSGRSDRGVAQVAELYQREVLQWGVVNRAQYRSAIGTLSSEENEKNTPELGGIIFSSERSFAKTGSGQTSNENSNNNRGVLGIFRTPGALFTQPIIRALGAMQYHVCNSTFLRHS